MNSLQPIQICYCGNRKVFPQILLSVMSVAMHTSAAVCVRVFTMELTEVDEAFVPITQEQRAVLEHVLRGKNAASSALLVDAGEEYRACLTGGKNERGFYTPYALLRLLFDKFELPDKLIYLDTDTMCCGDIKKLWDYDISGYEFGAVKDYEGSFWINRHYCNSGVLLMNMAECRRTDLLGRVRRRVLGRRMFMPDQSSLNKLAKKKLYLPRAFNEQRGIRRDTVIKHFCRGMKWYGPFFRLYNYKQTDRQNVHEKLGIYCFDDVYAQYDELQKKFDLGI